ncbi:MAG: family 20 glycosylhydrolase, partial [Psychrosphaera sp.]|nr:family 20 glycosylhydrolase [Psychrosphaera sp.]
KAMHSQAGHPLTRYHIGADETAGAWVKSPLCEKFFADNKAGIKEAKQLGGYFVEKVAAILTKRGIETAAWGDGLMHTDVDKMPSVVQANAWTPIWSGGHSQAHKLTNRNWQVVVSSPDVTYFDFPYEADPEEHGYYWASRQTNSRKVFEFMPDNLPVHAETRTNNISNELSLDDTTGYLAKGQKFHGLQGHLWSENVRSDAQAEYMLFPRLIALAERAWHKPTWEPEYNYEGAVYNKDSKVFNDQMREARNKQWNVFANVIARKEMPKLDKQGVFYRIPTVGATINQRLLRANVIFPGMSIEYQVNEEHWRKYSGPVAVTGEIKVRAVSADGKRKGRSLTVL